MATLIKKHKTKRPHRHAKKATSKNKRSNLYSKPYNRQG